MGFIGTAFAASGGARGSMLSMVPLLVLIAAVFYFLIWRPQNKRNKAQKELFGSMKKGDEVLTSGGIAGIITKISDSNDYIVVALNENNEISVRKSFVVAILPKNTISTAGNNIPAPIKNEKKTPKK